MKILFSPSQSKKVGGVKGVLDFGSYGLHSLSSLRREMVTLYNTTITAMTEREKGLFFETKDLKKIEQFSRGLDEQYLMKALERYDGVAYDYLAYSTLDSLSQKWLERHMMIFSDLLGPVLGGDMLPVYLFKQGAKLGTLKLENLYYQKSQMLVDDWIGDEYVVDLRATHYEKFYKLLRPHTCYKFLKDGKVVSHWAKAYRGKIAREIALHQPTTKEELLSLPIEGLGVEEIICKGEQTLCVMNILQ